MLEQHAGSTGGQTGMKRSLVFDGVAQGNRANVRAGKGGRRSPHALVEYFLRR
jgi:hypothetical protein